MCRATRQDQTCPLDVSPAGRLHRIRYIRLKKSSLTAAPPSPAGQPHQGHPAVVAAWVAAAADRKSFTAEPGTTPARRCCHKMPRQPPPPAGLRRLSPAPGSNAIAYLCRGRRQHAWSRGGPLLLRRRRRCPARRHLPRDPSSPVVKIPVTALLGTSPTAAHTAMVWLRGEAGTTCCRILDAV